jgi:hypothetical protein
VAAQGIYGNPIYACFEGHLTDKLKAKTKKDSRFRKSSRLVEEFLVSRLDRTLKIALRKEPAGDILQQTESVRDRHAAKQRKKEAISQISQKLHEEVQRLPSVTETVLKGLLLIVQPHNPESAFIYSTVKTERTLCRSRLRPEMWIDANPDIILKNIWLSSIKEAWDEGHREEVRSISTGQSEVIAPYCKAWPWLTLEWKCPFPSGKKEMLVEGIGVSPETYRALMLGAAVFNKLTEPVSHLVIPEIFSPSETCPGKEQAQRRKTLPAVYGSAFLLPIQDCWENDSELQQDFVEGVRGLLDLKPTDSKFEDRYIGTVIGFEGMLPPSLDTDDFRLTLVYFSGKYTRGDIHLRAYIQDVIPSTLKALRDMALKDTKDAMRLLRDLRMSDKQAAYYGQFYASVPYRLARAYGGGYLWQQLETVLRRRVLRTEQVTINAAHRMHSLTPQWPDSRYALYEEVGFYLSFLQFLERANREIANMKEGTVMPSPLNIDLPSVSY